MKTIELIKREYKMLTNEKVDSLIVNKTFTTLPEGRSIVCELTLRNGYTVHGISSVANIENFNYELGCSTAYGKARNLIFELQTYALKEMFYAAVH
jgi:hypothetical protein